MSQGASSRREEHPDGGDDDKLDDLYGADSFPASDPPSTWWGESKETAGAQDLRDDDGNTIRRAAEELLRRGRAGTGMTETTARYRQFQLAQLLGAVAQAVGTGEALPADLLRHATALAGHILAYPAAVTEPPAAGP